MQERRLNCRFWTALIGLLLILVLAAKGVSVLWTDTILDETDTPLGMGVQRTLAVMIMVICSSWLYSALVMLKQCIVHRGRGFILTEEGVEHTLTFVLFLAFVFVLPVRRIPWSAVKAWDAETGYIRVRRKPIRAGFLAKTLIAVKGYSFCNSFVKPELSSEEFEQFILPRLPKSVR